MFLSKEMQLMVANESAQTMVMAASTFSAMSEDSEDGEIPKSVIDDIDDCDALGGFLDSIVLGHSISGGLRLDRTHLRFS